MPAHLDNTTMHLSTTFTLAFGIIATILSLCGIWIKRRGKRASTLAVVMKYSSDSMENSCLASIDTTI